MALVRCSRFVRSAAGAAIAVIRRPALSPRAPGAGSLHPAPVGNALIMRGSMTIAKPFIEAGFLTTQALIQLAADHLIEANSRAETPGAQHLIDEVIQTLPSMARGLDVNVRFGECVARAVAPRARRTGRARE